MTTSLSGLGTPRLLSGELTQNETKKSADVEDNDQALVINTANITDALEELTTLMTQFRNRRDFERRMDFNTDPFLDTVLDDEAIIKFQQLVVILQNENAMSAKLFLHYARTLFADVSDLVVILREMLRRGGFDKLKRQIINETLYIVEDESDEKRVRSGINVALKARIFGQSLRLSPALIRESYRNFLESDHQELDIYQQWIDVFGYQYRSAVTDFMESALIADMESSWPGCSDIEFGYLFGRLGQIKLIRSADHIFVKAMAALFSRMGFPDNEQGWIYFMLCALEDTEDLMFELREIIRDERKRLSHQQKGVLLQGIFRYICLLPEAIYPPHTDREKLLIKLRNHITDNYKLEII